MLIFGEVQLNQFQKTGTEVQKGEKRKKIETNNAFGCLGKQWK